MLFRWGSSASEIGCAFFDEAGKLFDTPRHPWLGVSLYLISAFVLGNLLSEAWRASGMA